MCCAPSTTNTTIATGIKIKILIYRLRHFHLGFVFRFVEAPDSHLNGAENIGTFTKVCANFPECAEASKRRAASPRIITERRHSPAKMRRPAK
ncbi:hypothetical protein AVEN_200852-1 [Araneus ventricosus]|uniref:Uncharacterized protein n=1 Tax=Araneus ventricosus TaxID=182803 RepID=A0A4Y2VQH5_ARAVE|nr:hypothetical protein AVEN_200852-1 [Araneus ventricosus]